MKLSDADRENIEVLESIDIDESTLHLLLCRYFAYRQHGMSANESLEASIKWRMNESLKADMTAQRRAQGARDGWAIRRAKQAKEPMP